MINEVVPTTKKSIEWPDVRGYEIRVHAPSLNKSIPLSAHEYEVIDAKAAIINAAEQIEDITQKLRENFC
jgi:hypothetical protein